MCTFAARKPEKKKMNHKLCCIGYITRDKIVTPDNTVYMPGGTAFYFAKAVSRLQADDFLLVSALAEEDKAAAEEIIPEQMIPQIDIDAVLDLHNITPQFMNELKRMSPFGPENQKPVFCSLGVKDYGTSKLVGKDQDHIKLELIDDRSNTPIHGIAFGMHQHINHIKAMKPFDICYTIEENTYNGNTSLQLMIKDIKESNT